VCKDSLYIEASGPRTKRMATSTSLRTPDLHKLPSNAFVKLRLSHNGFQQRQYEDDSYDDLHHEQGRYNPSSWQYCCWRFRFPRQQDIAQNDFRVKAALREGSPRKPFLFYELDSMEVDPPTADQLLPQEDVMLYNRHGERVGSIGLQIALREVEMAGINTKIRGVLEHEKFLQSEGGKFQR